VFVTGQWDILCRWICCRAFHNVLLFLMMCF